MTTASEVQSHARRKAVWPTAVIVFGVSLTAAWTILLAYGLMRLIKYAI